MELIRLVVVLFFLNSLSMERRTIYVLHSILLSFFLVVYFSQRSLTVLTIGWRNFAFLQGRMVGFNFHDRRVAVCVVWHLYNQRIDVSVRFVTNFDLGTVDWKIESQRY